ncbi:MAG: hypothetical protein FRX49_13388 [Trebouxia sp. A1-2]|nr:MAG: hypothetical protein FRX49_13388 [Trebouxia sp. A1-2]
MDDYPVDWDRRAEQVTDAKPCDLGLLITGSPNIIGTEEGSPLSTSAPVYSNQVMDIGRKTFVSLSNSSSSSGLGQELPPLRTAIAAKAAVHALIALAGGVKPFQLWVEAGE